MSNSLVAIGITGSGGDINDALVKHQPILLHARNHLNLFLFQIPFEIIRVGDVQISARVLG